MSDCIEWAGYIKPNGYGQTGAGEPAHRAAYVASRGPIPEGLEIDHLCRNKQCVNPDHLEPVTRAENARRRFADYTHCANGHEYTIANTYRRPSGFRDCRACGRERVRAYKSRKKAAA